MAGTRRNELIGRLAGLSEETIQRLSDAPGADRVVGAVTTMRDRVDELRGASAARGSREEARGARAQGRQAEQGRWIDAEPLNREQEAGDREELRRRRAKKS
jgi:hypothetical protein